MKEICCSIGYLLLALVVMLFKAMFYLFVGIPILLWEKWCYTARCLRYPPPPGGMFGQMARHYKKQQNNRQSV